MCLRVKNLKIYRWGRNLPRKIATNNITFGPSFWGFFFKSDMHSYTGMLQLRGVWSVNLYSRFPIFVPNFTQANYFTLSTCCSFSNLFVFIYEIWRVFVTTSPCKQYMQAIKGDCLGWLVRHTHFLVRNVQLKILYCLIGSSVSVQNADSGAGGIR